MKYAALLLALALVPLASTAQTPQAPAPAMAAGKPASTPLSPDDQAIVDRAVTYLEGLSAATGRFAQTDARGTETGGTISLQRPGKARFEYDPPSGLLVVADGSLVSVLDRRLKTFDSTPEGATPLGLFLAGRIKLNGGVKVTRVAQRTDGFSLTAEDPRKLTRGSITLNFTDSPLTLAGWTLVDPRGGMTRVRLIDFKPSSRLDPSLFVLRDPRPAIHTR
ncbi:MAG: outer-membrane lipoprotein carrier protein LolA [Alphaproteobacteria bacterium]